MTRRLRRMFHLLMLCFGTALSTWGIHGWQPDAPLSGDALFTTALLAIGLALMPISLFEIFALEPRRRGNASAAPQSRDDTPP